MISWISRMGLRPYLNVMVNSKSTYIFKKNMYIPKKNTYIFFNVHQDPIKPYYVLDIHLRNFNKWFEIFPHPEFQFGIPCISLRKVHTFLLYIYILLKPNQDPIKPYYVLNINLGIFKKWFEAFSYPKFQFGNAWTFLRKIHTVFRKIHSYF